MYIALDSAGAKWLVWGTRRRAAQPKSAANLSRFYGSRFLFLTVDVLAFFAAVVWLLDGIYPLSLPINSSPLLIALLCAFSSGTLPVRKSPPLVINANGALDGAVKTHLLLNAATVLCVTVKVAILGIALFR